MPQLFDVARLGRDAELRATPSGESVINLALACDYGKKGQDGRRPTQWIDGTLWGKQAEALAPYLLKGQQVAVTVDDVHIEEYDSQGARRSKLVGTVSKLRLVGGSPQQGQQQGPQQGQQRQEYAPRQQPQRQQQAAPQQSQQAAPPDNFDDLDIPF